MPNFLLRRQQLKGFRPSLTSRYLNEIYGGGNTVGFKLMYSQVRRFPEIVPYLLKHRIAVIHLIRANILNSVLSGEVARDWGQFHFKEGDAIPDEKPMWVDPGYLVRAIRSIETRIRWAKRLLGLLGLPQIEIYYEDLQSDVRNFAPIWDFLGVDFRVNPPVWQFRKSRRKSPEEIITNFHEVQAALVEAGYQRFWFNDLTQTGPESVQ